MVKRRCHSLVDSVEVGSSSTSPYITAAVTIPSFLSHEQLGFVTVYDMANFIECTKSSKDV